MTCPINSAKSQLSSGPDSQPWHFWRCGWIMFCWVWGDCPVPVRVFSVFPGLYLPVATPGQDNQHAIHINSKKSVGTGRRNKWLWRTWKGLEGRLAVDNYAQQCCDLLYIYIQMTKIIFLIYLDKVLAHSSQSRWNLLSDKSNGSICVHVPAHSASLDSVKISIYSWLIWGYGGLAVFMTLFI